jgi:hypothetical protein
VTIAAFQGTAATRLRRVVPTNVPDRSRPLPLRTELFLIAHDDDTGRPHVDPDTLSLGLAAAVLLELWLSGRVHIGWRYDARTGRGVLDPGLISVLDATPIGDPLTDSVLANLWHTGGGLRAHEFITQLADTGLYERVRADMIAAGIIHRTTRRRFWLFRTDVYQPVHSAHSVRARFRIRQLADGLRRDTTGRGPDPRVVALSGLITVLGLTGHLYPPDTTPTRLHERLRHVIDELADPTIRDVTAAIMARNGRTPPATR